ncbi:MAG: DUF1648 domain-containing protein [Eubacteriaceae bacterium]|nr:DUF1648 domain-containing protein [Eubacteriaceae bacterium]
MKIDKLNISVLILSVLSFIGISIMYFYLPDTIPIHWNINGEVDNYGGKATIFLLGALPAAMWLLMMFLPKIDPRRENYKLHAKAYEIIILSIILIFIALGWITVYAALGHSIKINLYIPLLIGILFIIIGNYMPTIKHNYFFGIRNPWTLANEVVWKKTHKAGGYAFIIMGIFFGLDAFIKSKALTIASIIVIGILIIAVNVYSFLLFQKIKR